MKTIFISRKLTKESVFKKDLKAAGFQIYDRSLIRFSPVAFDTVPSTDWIFFYSKNAVKYFFAGLTSLNQITPQEVRWATIGPATAKVLKKHIGQVDFIGDGNTVETAADFLKVAEGQTVLFPRAEHSRKTVQQLLSKNITDRDLIVYKNVPKKNIRLPNCDLLVFTSPMNVLTYFKNKPLFDDQSVFAIGRTTAKTLVSIGIEEFLIAEEPSEAALVKAVLS
jgi:uroporphyrinogen-III synthase